MSLARRLRAALLTISPSEAVFEERGFHAGLPAKQERFETIGGTFVAGYNAAVGAYSIADLEACLRTIDDEFRGFAFEGAAMALTLLDGLLPGKQRRFRAFLTGPGEPHTYMLHVGAGWAIARMPWARVLLDRSLASYDPLLRGLVVDGYGFHEGYFHWPIAGAEQRVPRSLRGYWRRAFDQGLGRSMWFACCGDVSRVCQTIEGFEERRRSDLWSGIGLAIGYAGGHTPEDLSGIRTGAGEHLPALAQGAAFAAKARIRAGNPTPHTGNACLQFCGMTATDAAGVTDAALRHLPADGGEPAYEIWRQRVQREFPATERRR